MNKTRIDWADYTINPIKGMCKNDCWYCYAKRMYERFGWDKEIRVDEKCLLELDKIKKPSKIFVGSMHDLFGNWIEDDFISGLRFYLSHYPQHIFIFLTKFPERYSGWEFPSNFWLGVSVTGEEPREEQERLFSQISNVDNVKFISYEPLLGSPELEMGFVDWVIIGGLTPKPKHKIKWVRELLDRYRHHQVPIFLKSNLNWHKKIQEYPIINQ